MALQTPKLFLPPSEPPTLLRHPPALLSFRISAVSGRNSSSGKKGSAASASNSNYVVPLDKSSCITRPLGEILRDLNKRIPDNIINTQDHRSTFIPWYHANRMLSFYAPVVTDDFWPVNISQVLLPKHLDTLIAFSAQVPNRLLLIFLSIGWCGEIRDVIFSENGSVTVVYRVTIRASDGEAHRESTGTVSADDGYSTDPVAKAEEIAFCRACARFGLGLYLYHDV